MKSPEFGQLYFPQPDVKIIKELRNEGYIREGSPLWWSTDYSPDPREYVPFAEFKNRLLSFGLHPILSAWPLTNPRDTMMKDIYLYPFPTVPITILNLPIDGHNLPFLVTVRPYHPKEFKNLYSSETPPIVELSGFFHQGGVLKVLRHFYPHIRGLFAGKRGNHFFWYILNLSGGFESSLRNSLINQGLSFLDIYQPTYYSTDRTYNEVWNELSGKEDKFDLKKPVWPNFKHYSEVSAEEFIEEWRESKEELIVFYPLRVLDVKETLPVVVSTKTHERSIIRKPVVLGVYAESQPNTRCGKWGILRIKDRKLAEFISSKISEDFGFPVDTVLFTPHTGRPIYERVTGLDKIDS